MRFAFGPADTLIHTYAPIASQINPALDIFFFMVNSLVISMASSLSSHMEQQSALSFFDAPGDIAGRGVCRGARNHFSEG